MKLADLEIVQRERIVIARVSGEIDMSNAGELMRSITAATDNEALGVILDLTAVEYLDSAGIHLLYNLREALRAHGQRLRLVIPEGSVVRGALRLAGVESQIDSAPTLDEALRGLEPTDPPAP